MEKVKLLTKAKRNKNIIFVIAVYAGIGKCTLSEIVKVLTKAKQTRIFCVTAVYAGIGKITL